MNFTGCTEKVSEACTHKSFEIIQTVDINQSNSSLIPATTKRQNNWIESCAAYAEFCRSHIFPMMNQNKLCHHKGISDREKINLNRSNITRSYEANRAARQQNSGEDCSLICRVNFDSEFWLKRHGVTRHFDLGVRRS